MRDGLSIARSTYENAFLVAREGRFSTHFSDVDANRRKKRDSYFRHGALFISFHRVLTHRQWIKPNIGAGGGWASLIYAIRRACIIGASAKFSNGENSALRRYGPFECRSRILLGRVSTVTSIRHALRSAGNLARDWSLFEASYDAASLQLYTR